jgi:hypothetical protein
MNPEPLLPFADQPLHSFYVQAVCGGITIASGSGRPPIEAPLAFQSALAGIALAADLVAEAGQLRPKPLATKTVLNVLKPVGNHLNYMVAKSPENATATCLCRDPDFVQAYCEKHGLQRSKSPRRRVRADRRIAGPAAPTATTSGGDRPA